MMETCWAKGLVFQILDGELAAQKFYPLYRCCCNKSLYVKVEGSLTKQSATYYVDALAAAIAEDFASAILAMRRRLREEDPEVEGLENQLVDEVMLSAQWSVKRDWKFQAEGHNINLLEIRALHRLVRDQVYQKVSYRIAAMVDSYVIREAVSKGRSSSRAITALFETG